MSLAIFHGIVILKLSIENPRIANYEGVNRFSKTFFKKLLQSMNKFGIYILIK